MSFDLGDYVDVAERIRIFREKHPGGSLQSQVDLYQDQDDRPFAVMVRAWAYRAPDDPKPGMGHSWMAIPGTTPYTRGSEVENAETSAWGRAIVAALAADTKKVASADEVRSKQDSGARHDSHAAGAGGRTDGDQTAARTTPDGGLGAQAGPGTESGPANTWAWPFGKHKGKTLADTPDEYLDWFLEKSDKEDIKDRIRAHREGALDEAFAAAGATLDDDIPFATTIDGLGN